MNILDTSIFKNVMFFKFFMVICIWGLIPLLIPKELLPSLGLFLNSFQVNLLRIWGAIVLLDTLIYLHIYKFPHKKFSKYLLLFSIVDNGGIGLMLLVLTLLFHLPWGIWVNIPFQLFFGYWFLRFYREGNFNKT